MSFFAIYPAVAGGGGSSGITSINADTTAAQVIAAGSGISVSSVGGTTTISNTGGSGTVTSVSVTTANGVSGSVATATTTPAISLTLGAITPSSVAAVGTVTGSNLSGTNTGDQTITLTGDVTGSGTGSFAATIAALAVTTAKINNAAVDLTTKVTGVLPVVNGGTNSSAALANGRAIVSTAGALVESATTSTEVGYLSGVTSAIQTQLNGKQATGNYITALTGDVTAAGPGSVAATIANSAVTNAKIANTTIDLTAKVTGALPIANGGTGQTTANPAFNALSPLTTKGDLIAFSTVNARVPVGTDGQVLVADSGAATGVSWSSTVVPNVTQGAAGLVASAGQLLGTNTNDSASTGNVGERVVSFIAQGSPVACTVATPTNLTSISLGAGDWEVYGQLQLSGTVAGSSNVTMSLNTTSATIGTLGNNALQDILPGGGVAYIYGGSMSERFSLSGTTTVYFVVLQDGAGSMDAFGRLSARRFR